MATTRGLGGPPAGSLVPPPWVALAAHRRCAGIGRPEKFFATLADCGAELAGRRAFPDHHPYSRKELDALLARAAALDAVAITTEKDAVRLPAGRGAEVAVLAVTLRWRDPAAPARLLDRILDAGLGHDRG